MIRTLGANANLFSLPTYTNPLSATNNTSLTNNIVDLLTEQYQPSNIDSLSSSWDLLTQSYSPQSVLNYYNQQQNNTSTMNDNFQQQVMNEIQTNPEDAIAMEQDNSLNSLIQSELGGSANLSPVSPDNLSALASNYGAANMSGNLNLNPSNVQQEFTEIQNNPVDAVQMQQEQAMNQLLQSQFGVLGNNLDISI